MIRSYNHTSFEVSAMDRSIAFYTEILGARLLDLSFRELPFSEKVSGLPGVRLKIAYLDMGGSKLELIEYVGREGFPKKIVENSKSAHVCFNVTDLRAFYRDYKDKVRFFCEPLRIPGGPNKNGFMAYLFDPDSNKIEFIEPPRAKLSK